MSDNINQVKQKVKQSLPKKKFDSKTLQHVNNYSLVKQLEQLILSISIFQSIYQQFILPVYQFLIGNVLTISPIYEVAQIFDGLNLYALGIFDHFFIDLPNKVINFTTANFIKPVNQQIIHINNAFLKPVENEAEDSIFQIYYTIKSIVLNITGVAYSKSNEIQHQIVSTYNQELKSTPANKSYLEKNLTASYNTGVKTVKVLNDDYIVPLKNQTQEFVTNGKKNAEVFLKETRDKIEPRLNEAANELNKQKDDLLKNNSVPVPAN
ncbi:hypothetical protein FOB58_001450 [Candida parapsilosis]|uniref:Uncharacterized protein n=1 Tax=Candida parapsilosis TaxID=5480 RepID=A0A8X7TC39_CANPA|nr:hypothetical protein FOB58_001450 [Candida parapsilosis]KAF6053113.1 hypothetical protein FOB60_003369 [Candida parapsilosis]KAF6053192.1 hypothetical protein FOB59_001474 [Candida parapsilosis]KAF6064891.1 hypothetical protein FOB61_003317 [Candida parapsilosis]KAI5911032.1 hypothetical protein K4G61_g4733 [Candida parapsilosis]